MKAKSKLKFKPTPISRLLRSPKSPFPYVGYPRCSDWSNYQHVTYKYMMAQKTYASQGPFVEASGAIAS